MSPDAFSPGSAQSLDLAPMLLPIEFGKNFERLSEEFRQSCRGGEKLNLRETADERGMAFGAGLLRTIFSKDTDVIDQHIGVSAAQRLFYFQDRQLLKNLGRGRAQKSEKKF